MELIAINLARLLAFLEIQGFDPRGRTSTPDGFKRIGNRYSFVKIPEKFEEFNFEKGVEFLAGKLGEINIDKLTLYGDGLIIDTRSSSDDCDAVLADLLAAVKEERGVWDIKPSRRLRLSNIVFRSDLKLSLLHPALQLIADRVAKAVSADIRQDVRFEPSSLALGAETFSMKLAVNPFNIERRLNVPFSENTYFSSAPLSTAQHLELLEELEGILTS